MSTIDNMPRVPRRNVSKVWWRPNLSDFLHKATREKREAIKYVERIARCQNESAGGRRPCSRSSVLPGSGCSPWNSRFHTAGGVWCR